MKDWLDGPKFAEWLEHRLEREERSPGDISGGLTRRIYGWKRGEVVSVYTADRWLTKAGYHLSELPDDFYRDPPRRKYSTHFSAQERRRALSLIEEGRPPVEVASEIGVNPRTLFNWRKQAA